MFKLTSDLTCAVWEGRAQAECTWLGGSWSWQVTHQEAGQKLSSRGWFWRGGGAQGHWFSAHWQRDRDSLNGVEMNSKVFLLVQIFRWHLCVTSFGSNSFCWRFLLLKSFSSSPSLCLLKVGRLCFFVYNYKLLTLFVKCLDLVRFNWIISQFVTLQV